MGFSDVGRRQPFQRLQECVFCPPPSLALSLFHPVLWVSDSLQAYYGQELGNPRLLEPH